MGKSTKFTETQILGILKQIEVGASVDSMAETYGISHETIYAWREKFSKKPKSPHGANGAPKSLMARLGQNEEAVKGAVAQVIRFVPGNRAEHQQAFDFDGDDGSFSGHDPFEADDYSVDALPSGRSTRAARRSKRVRMVWMAVTIFWTLTGLTSALVSRSRHARLGAYENREFAPIVVRLQLNDDGTAIYKEDGPYALLAKGTWTFTDDGVQVASGNLLGPLQITFQGGQAAIEPDYYLGYPTFLTKVADPQ